MIGRKPASQIVLLLCSAAPRKGPSERDLAQTRLGSSWQTRKAKVCSSSSLFTRVSFALLPPAMNPRTRNLRVMWTKREIAESVCTLYCKVGTSPQMRTEPQGIP